MSLLRLASCPFAPWYDTNANGIQDAGEVGVSGITVNLYNNGVCSGAPASTMQTDADGIYLFTGLQAGTYCVEFIKPAGFIFSPQNQGVDDAVDSDADLTTGRTASISLAAGQSDRTWDAGIYQPEPQPAELGDRVWYDENGNGLQDDGEPGVPNVPVHLFANCSGTAIATQQTDANGIYLFTNLAPGSYCVQFDKPDGYSFTGRNVGSNSAIDSDADRTTGRTVATTLTPGESDRTWDAGIYLPAALGDRVWIDLIPKDSANGKQDSSGGTFSEPGVPTFIAELYRTTEDPNGVLVATQSTDANGNYLFTDLAPGTYFVIFRLPDNLVGIWTIANATGVADDVNSDAADSLDNDTARRTREYTLAAGEVNLTVDAGLISLTGLANSAIGDRVWLDNNKNGIQDEGEPSFEPPVAVNLYRDGVDAPIATQLTSGGLYLFDGLDSGTYCVGFVIPDGYTVTTPNAGDNPNLDSDAISISNGIGRTTCFNLPTLTTDLSWDLGIYPTDDPPPPTNLDPTDEPANFAYHLMLPLVIR